MDRTFVITVVGAFSGRTGDAAPRALPIDRDDFDSVFRALAPRAAGMTMASWEDLRPEGLVQRVPELRDLRAARDAAADPARMAELLRKAGVGAAAAPAPPARPVESAPPGGPPPDGASLLEDLLEAKGPGAGPAGSAGDAVDRRIREIVEASVDRTDYAGQERRRAHVDAELGARLNAVLRHPDFRAMESRWASLRRLVRAAETGETLRLRVVDATSFGPAPILAGDADARTSLLVTDRILDAGDAGFAALAELVGLAERLDVPVLAGWNAAASPPGALAADARWRELRASPGARRIGICAPRILARLPYGRDTDPVEGFAFEEDADPARADSYCWGSAAFELAAAAAVAWSATGSLGRLDRCLEIDRLPQHVTRSGGETATCGPVERVLTEPEIDAWKAAGLIPVTGVRGREAARILSTRALSSEPLFAG